MSRILINFRDGDMGLDETITSMKGRETSMTNKDDFNARLKTIELLVAIYKSFILTALPNISAAKAADLAQSYR